MGSEYISGHVTKVFPVVADNAVLPYIVYRRVSLQSSPVKGGHGAEEAQIEVSCFTKEYTEGVELAEAVRSVLDGARGGSENITIRRCSLGDSDESWQGDAYVQNLVFNISV